MHRKKMEEGLKILPHGTKNRDIDRCPKTSRKATLWANDSVLLIIPQESMKENGKDKRVMRPMLGVLGGDYQPAATWGSALSATRSSWGLVGFSFFSPSPSFCIFT
jgi:hypothetical protein